MARVPAFPKGGPTWKFSLKGEEKYLGVELYKEDLRVSQRKVLDLNLSIKK